MSDKFISRDKCINCGSRESMMLSRGKYGDQPLRGFIENDPTGEDPMPYLEDCAWEFMKCNECSQMYHRYIASPETDHLRFNVWTSQEAIEEFERLHQSETAKFERGRKYVSHILRLQKLSGNKVKLLDFGCGWGAFITLCSGFGFDAYGVDKSTARRAGAYTRISPSIEELGQKDFNVVTLFEVLEHLDNPFEVLQQLAGIMVEGGILILETPDCTGVTGINDYQSYLNIHPLEHINGFTPETLQSIAERAGFYKIRQPVAHVTTSKIQLIKKEARGLLQGFIPSTQLYFRKG